MRIFIASIWRRLYFMLNNILRYDKIIIMANAPTYPQDAKKVFMQCGTCSQTFGHLLNSAFQHHNELAEKALDPLAGGIINQGHQCGMLWGSALAIGAESYRRYQDIDKAVAAAMIASQYVMHSFTRQTGTPNCKEITGYDLSTMRGMVGYMIKTFWKGMKNSPCFNMAEEWAPDAIQSAEEGLEDEHISAIPHACSCATEVAKRMGASEEEAVMVAGFAGGIGLSGQACGALGAAIWMKTLAWCKAHPGKSPPFFGNADGKKLLKSFREETQGEMLCSEITGRNFNTVDEHTSFVKNGGCARIIEVLSEEKVR